MRARVFTLASAALLLIGALVWGQETQPKQEIQPKTPQNEAFDAIKKLAGTWEMTAAAPGEKPAQITFKVTAGGSAVQETMFAGAAHEMINMYTRDGATLLMTHY